jgi:WD40 repeat protein
VKTGQPLGKPLSHQDEVTCAAFSRDGKTVVTGSKDQTAQLWRVSTTEPLGAPLTHQGAVLDVAFTPDGLAVVTASVDATSRIWDVATARPLGPAMRHRDVVTALCISPDGTRLITGSQDKTARIWELPETVNGSPQRLAVWVQTLCGMQLASNEALGVLTPEDWQERLEELRKLGGPPITK